MREIHASRRRAGFTLVELMIVVSIISLLAAIAIPNLIESRKVVEEKRAWQTLRAIYAAQQQYKEKFGVYAPGIRNLVAAGLLQQPFSATGGDTQPLGGWEYATVVPTGHSASSEFRIMAEPYGGSPSRTSTADRLRTGDQILFMVESGQIFTHRYYQGCSLSHGLSTIQTTDPATSYPATDGL